VCTRSTLACPCLAFLPSHADPYTGTDGTCHAATSVASVGSHTDVTPNSDTAMMTAIAQQPVSIAVEADQSSFQFYR